MVFFFFSVDNLEIRSPRDLRLHGPSGQIRDIQAHLLSKFFCCTGVLRHCRCPDADPPGRMRLRSQDKQAPAPAAACTRTHRSRHQRRPYAGTKHEPPRKHLLSRRLAFSCSVQRRLFRHKALRAFRCAPGSGTGAGIAHCSFHPGQCCPPGTQTAPVRSDPFPPQWQCSRSAAGKGRCSR